MYRQVGHPDELSCGPFLDAIACSLSVKPGRQAAPGGGAGISPAPYRAMSQLCSHCVVSALWLGKPGEKASKALEMYETVARQPDC